MNERFDYIVVGAGSAGCVLARRLSDQAGVRVLLLEAGPPPSGFWQRVPAGMAKLFGANPLNWSYMTEPIPTLKDRRLFWPRGKTLGGSSAINGMVFTRGLRQDYDEWEAMGNPGWAWKDVLPFFKRIEDNALGASEYRAVGGHLRIGEPAVKPPVMYRFIESATRYGLRPVEEMSVAGEEGVGVLQASIADGLRQSAYDAYLARVRQRPNLSISTSARALRIELDGSTAVGVEVEEADGARRLIRAEREVIVSAGALNSPQLLMLSGIGDRTELQRHGIRSRLHLPGVGRNLQDHYSVLVKVRTAPGWSHNPNLLGWRKYYEGARYLLTRGGYLACGATLAAAFVRSDEHARRADLDIGFRPVTFSYAPSGDVAVDADDAIALSVFVCRPESRGQVRLRSADPSDAPVLIPNYFSSERDMRATIKGIRHIRNILKTEPLAACVLDEVSPGPDMQSDDDLAEFIQATGKTSFHVSGTCKMGRDETAVVDHRLRVRGCSRLRVVDASIMPVVTSGNTNAPAIMIGEKGADMIIEDARLTRRPYERVLSTA